eukprot:TRINITY_DN17902_c0_g4_i1.p1 TRINITY_DN17902_c0_g4~~TRINITY_DN17902_c0_g4_i1.p1  ORF type:complete len:1344 (-),score=324.63 TRINITY_DN17902_c0_g4_i1:71-4102(-)
MSARKGGNAAAKAAAAAAAAPVAVVEDEDEQGGLDDEELETTERAADGVVAAPLADEGAADGAVAAAAAGAAAGGSLPSASARSPIARAILAGGGTLAVGEVRLRGQEWAQLCLRDPVGALLEAVRATIELAGLALRIEVADLDAGPETFIAALPDRAREGGSDPSVYPLLPKTNSGKKAVDALERFWASAIAAQSMQAMFEGGFLDTLGSWLLVMSRVPIRSLRHVATVAVLAVADALGHQYQTLIRTRDALHTQLAAVGSRNKRQLAQLERDAQESSEHVDKLFTARSKLLEGTVPPRSRDVSEDIRLHMLSAVDRLMRKDPETYLQSRFTARVFLMTHDPWPDVRLKALQVIHHWYTNQNYSEAVKENLQQFASRFLHQLVERTADVDPRVMVAALRCLRLPALAEQLEEKVFDDVVNLCVGSREQLVREEAALFINSHVFQDPGICLLPKKHGPRRGGGSGAPGGGGGGAGEEEDLGAGGGEAAEPRAEDGLAAPKDNVRELYDSETSLSMLMEFIESYINPRMRITERAVGAFWAYAPSLSHWSTMVNLCLIGEGRGTAMEPLNPAQRLALLYIMEASVRRAREDLQSIKQSERDAAVTKLNDACAHIIPELPQLMKVCLTEEKHSLLLSHVCKILIEYAVENAQNQVLVNPKALCQWLEQFINGQTSLDTAKYCVDALVSLARVFAEAKDCFLELAKSWHHRCNKLLEPAAVAAGTDELRSAMGRYVVLANRAIDMAFGCPHVQSRIMDLLEQRIAWTLKEEQKPANEGANAGGESAATEVDANTASTQIDDDTAEAGAGEGEEEKAAPTADAAEALASPPAGVPDERLALQLLEAATITVFWHIKMVYWIEQEESTDAQGNAKAQISEMLQNLGNFATMRSHLVPVITRLRNICIGVISADKNRVVRFHAFSAYMSISQYAVAVSDRLALDAQPAGGEAPAPGLGDLFEVNIPREHNETLWKYLNGMYQLLIESAGSVPLAAFEQEGQRVQAIDAYPAPSLGTVTAPRFLTTAVMEALDLQPKQEKDAEVPAKGEADLGQELLIATLVSRMVSESEVEDIIAGPLGMLLLLQVERGCPRPVRDVAFGFLRRLSAMARTCEDYALLYFSVQAKAIFSLFDCSGGAAAHSLCGMLLRHWGVKIGHWLEPSFYIVLRETLQDCITSDKRTLPLLDTFSMWLSKVEDPTMRGHGKELADAIQQRCTQCGLDVDADPLIESIVRRLRPPIPIAGAAAASEAPAAAAAAAAPAAEGASASRAPSAMAPPSPVPSPLPAPGAFASSPVSSAAGSGALPAHRLSGKRSPASLQAAAAEDAAAMPPPPSPAQAPSSNKRRKSDRS